jgi:predicted DNA-binding WGR domain protein
MRKHLKYIDGTADKFWQIEVHESTFTVTYGKNGTIGTTQTKTFDSADDCLKTAEKLLAEKIKKGYSESGEVTLSSASAKPKVDGQGNKKADLQTVLADFDTIIRDKKINDLLPFLKEKSVGNKEGLKKHIKACKRYWMTYVELSKETFMDKLSRDRWGQRGDDMQHKIITLSAVALFDKTDIASWQEAFRLLNEPFDTIIFDILLWAKPNWIDAVLLERFKKESWFTFDYLKLRYLEDNQLINYNSELFAICLSTYSLYQYPNRTSERALTFIDLIVNDERAFQRDVPELFNYETNLNSHIYSNEYVYHDRNTNRPPIETFNVWEIIFNKLIAENKLDKQFFIEQCLQIQTKEWNNNLKYFFRKRLEDLNLSGDDLLPFQETIFTFFHAAFPPIVTYGVENVKELYQNPSFNTTSFLEWIAPMMMRADCKTAIKSLLPILEKINKMTPQYNGEIAALIADIFVIPDMNLQERAAKIILKIANKNDEELKEKLTQYIPLMQGQVRILLQGFLIENEEFTQNTERYEIYEFAPKKEQLLTEKIVLPTDWNGIVFQFGKFINSSDVLDAEIILNSFVTQRHLFPDDFTEQLQPYFKQLEGKYFAGIYKQIMKGFLMQKIVHFQKSFVLNQNYYHNTAKTLASFSNIVFKADNKITSNSNLPLLSMPTHAPFWVEPKTLIERLIAYQNAKEEIDRVDLCIAISRMPRENTEEAIQLLPKLEPEMAKLMAFSLGISRTIEFSEPTSIFSKVVSFMGGNTQKTENISLWAVAARTFYPKETFVEFEKTYLADVPFVVAPFKPKPYFLEQWTDFKNYKTNKMERSPSWFELYFTSPEFKSTPSYLLYSLDASIRGKTWDHRLLCAEDFNYWHAILPQNSEPLALNLMGFACKKADVGSNDLIGFLNILNRPEFWFSDITTLVFACCFFQEKKDIRFLTTEVLIQLIENKKIDAEQLGEKLAFLITGKYGVLLRFIDTLAGIKDVSPLHNSTLFIVLDTIFKHAELGDKLPTNFKKLVEHYADIVAKTQQKPSANALHFFDKLGENAALKGLIKQLKLAN